MISAVVADLDQDGAPGSLCGQKSGGRPADQRQQDDDPQRYTEQHERERFFDVHAVYIVEHQGEVSETEIEAVDLRRGLFRQKTGPARDVPAQDQEEDRHDRVKRIAENG